MALAPAELRRRLIAGRELRGLDQKAMGQKLREEGLGRTDAARLERGEIEFTRSHLGAYSRVLELPGAWFTEESLGDVFSAAHADELKRELEVLKRQLRAAQDQSLREEEAAALNDEAPRPKPGRFS